MRFLLTGYFGEALLYLIHQFERWHYVGPFVVLLLCGLGLPLPEEVSLVGCGYLMYRGYVDFLPVTLVCSAAILLGDSIPYSLGRRYGLSALRNRWVARFVHPEMFAKVERKFQDNRNWAIFTCRFLPGLRIPAYFIAGTFGMSYVRFLVLDSIGVLISVPTSIWVAYWFFDKIGFEPESVAAKVSHYNHVILAGVVVAVLTWILWRRLRRRVDKPASV